MFYCILNVSAYILRPTFPHLSFLFHLFWFVLYLNKNFYLPPILPQNESFIKNVHIYASFLNFQIINVSLIYNVYQSRPIFSAET